MTSSNLVTFQRHQILLTYLSVLRADNPYPQKDQTDRESSRAVICAIIMIVKKKMEAQTLSLLSMFTIFTAVSECKDASGNPRSSENFAP